MKKEKKIPPFEKLRYELASVRRWNVCQKIAKYLHRSDRSLEILEAQMQLLEDEFLNTK